MMMLMFLRYKLEIHTFLVHGGNAHGHLPSWGDGGSCWTFTG